MLNIEGLFGEYPPLMSFIGFPTVYEREGFDPYIVDAEREIYIGYGHAKMCKNKLRDITYNLCHPYS